MKWLKPNDTPAHWWFSLQGSNTQEPINLRFLAWRYKGISRVYHCICRNLWSYVGLGSQEVPHAWTLVNSQQPHELPWGRNYCALRQVHITGQRRMGRARNRIKIKCQVQWIENNILGVPKGIIPADKNASWMIVIDEYYCRSMLVEIGISIISTIQWSHCTAGCKYFRTRTKCTS